MVVAVVVVVVVSFVVTVVSSAALAVSVGVCLAFLPRASALNTMFRCSRTAGLSVADAELDDVFLFRGSTVVFVGNNGLTSNCSKKVFAHENRLF